MPRSETSHSEEEEEQEVQQVGRGGERACKHAHAHARLQDATHRVWSCFHACVRVENTSTHVRGAVRHG